MEIALVVVQIKERCISPSDLSGCCATSALIRWPRYRAPRLEKWAKFRLWLGCRGQTRRSASCDKKQPPADGAPRVYAAGAPIDITPGAFLLSSAYGYNQGFLSPPFFALEITGFGYWTYWDYLRVFYGASWAPSRGCWGICKIHN